MWARKALSRVRGGKEEGKRGGERQEEENGTG